MFAGCAIALGAGRDDASADFAEASPVRRLKVEGTRESMCSELSLTILFQHIQREN